MVTSFGRHVLTAILFFNQFNLHFHILKVSKEALFSWSLMEFSIREFEFQFSTEGRLAQQPVKLETQLDKIAKFKQKRQNELYNKTVTLRLEASKVPI